MHVGGRSRGCHLGVWKMNGSAAEQGVEHLLGIQGEGQEPKGSVPILFELPGSFISPG